MKNVAQEVLFPNDGSIVVRVVFLYVGQGASALVLVRDARQYQSMLVDINLDYKAGGIDVPRLVADLVGPAGLDVFINTHPHKDHLAGISELAEVVDVGAVWHSGLVPGGDHCLLYEDLMKLCEWVQESSGEVAVLQGSQHPRSFGEATYYSLAPAPHVADEIAEEDEEARYARIHEHCAVLRIGAGDSWVLLAGDAECDAWQKHITDYHRERLRSDVLAAPHHGSHTFFCENEGEEPCMDALEAIDPTYVVVSAPLAEESDYDHPRESAMKLYAAQCGSANVFHTGKDRFCFICDIRPGQPLEVYSDQGKLTEYYGLRAAEADAGVTRGSALPLVRPVYCEAPRWEVRRDLKVSMKAWVYRGSSNSQPAERRKLRELVSDGSRVSSDLWIRFSAKVKRLPPGAQIWWQIVNTGEHARSLKAWRGELFEGQAVRWESTLYTGKHWAECFVVHDGVCIGRSGRFFVSIYNRDFPL